MSKLSFRRATAADIPAIMQIRLSVRENMLDDPSNVTPAMCEQYLDALGRGWVCEDDGGVIGFSYAAVRDASIWALFVLPGHEGRGIGKELLRLAVEWLFSLGHGEVVLTTSDDTRAARFYAAQGWSRVEMKDDVEVRFRLRRDRSVS